MKLEYRDLSSSEERLKRRKRLSLGFLDFFAGSLFLFVLSSYFVLPQQLDRAINLVAYDSSSNSYASLECISDHTTHHRFTLTKDVTELRASTQVVHQNELDRFGKPQPDPACFAARGFVERVSRWEYFFGWLLRAVG